MRTSSRLYVPFVLALFLLMSFALGVLPVPTEARSPDDDGASAPPASKPAADSADAKKANVASDPSAGLTERERMLLDRVEQLERRVAELEAAHGSANAAAESPAPDASCPPGCWTP